MSSESQTSNSAPDHSQSIILSKKDVHGITFQKNKTESVHRWFPYVEGFAGRFVRDTLIKFDLSDGPILDPFGGCGSTALECSLNGIESWSVDINPFMVFVAQTKTSLNLNVVSVKTERERLQKSLSAKAKGDSLNIINPLFLHKDYFSPRVFKKIARL